MISPVQRLNLLLIFSPMAFSQYCFHGDRCLVAEEELKPLNCDTTVGSLTAALRVEKCSVREERRTWCGRILEL